MIRIILTVIFLLSFFVSPSLAVTVNISTPSASIDQSQDLNLDVSLTCSNCGDSYLRGVFFETSDNYFGLTQNNSGDWVGTSSDRTKYFKVAKEELINNSWNGKLSFKIDIDNPYYKGSGNYSVKIGRYTSSSGSSATWSDSYFISVVGPTPTPTSTPTPTPTPTSTPTPTPTPTVKPTSTPTSTPKPTNSPTPTPTVKASPSASPEATVNLVVNKEEVSGTVSGAQVKSNDFVNSSVKENYLPAVLLGVSGLLILAAGGSMAWIKKKHQV